MSDNSGRVVLVMSSVALMVGVPVLLGSLYNSWRVMVEARTESMGRPELPVENAPPSGEPVDDAPQPDAPAYVPPPPTEIPLEQFVPGLLEVELTSPHVDDWDPTLPYRLSVDGAEGLATTATVDLGRDGTIDEYWTLRPELGREVVEGGARHRMVRRDGAWVRE